MCGTTGKEAMRRVMTAAGHVPCRRIRQDNSGPRIPDRAKIEPLSLASHKSNRTICPVRPARPWHPAQLLVTRWHCFAAAVCCL
jgi:hypothetical protein